MAKQVANAVPGYTYVLEAIDPVTGRRIERHVSYITEWDVHYRVQLKNGGWSHRCCSIRTWNKWVKQVYTQIPSPQAVLFRTPEGEHVTE